MRYRYFPILLISWVFLFPGNALAQLALKDLYKGQFLIGVALNDTQFSGKNSVEATLIKAQFNSITPENCMKWAGIQPDLGKYQFEAADRFVEFGEKNGMAVIGHTLVWHSQAPDWLFKDGKGGTVSREVLLERMRDHIHKVVGRYKGRVKGWDVVNEVVDDSGRSLRSSPWQKIVGEEYIAKAFQFAHEADPQAELYYNDYGIEGGAKHAAALALVKRLKAANVPITGVGIQGHMSLKWSPIKDLDKAITAFGQLGLKVMITELDVDVLPSRTGGPVNADVSRKEAADPKLNPYTGGLPAKVQQELARYYADLFSLCLKHRGTITRVTFWGTTDANTWLNNFPIQGRTNHPLLFDRKSYPKPAYFAVADAPQLFSSGGGAPKPQPDARR